MLIAKRVLIWIAAGLLNIRWLGIAIPLALLGFIAGGWTLVLFYIVVGCAALTELYSSTIHGYTVSGTWFKSAQYDHMMQRRLKEWKTNGSVEHGQQDEGSQAKGKAEGEDPDEGEGGDSEVRQPQPLRF